MNYLTKQIPYTSSLKKQFIIGLIAGGLLSFILIFLEPFNSNEFESDIKNEIFLGFGFFMLVPYIIHVFLENILYNKTNKIWTIKQEITSLIIYYIFSGSIIYLYNHLFLNELNYSLKSHFSYFTRLIAAFIPIFTPLLLFLRNKFGEKITPMIQNRISIKGINKDEVLELQKDNLLYIKASENYIEIFFNADNNTHHKVFRNTLSNIHKQLPFLEKCHRSYLVNTSIIQNIKGNSQSAFIVFNNSDIKIPLSKTFYKKIKTNLSN